MSEVCETQRAKSNCMSINTKPKNLHCHEFVWVRHFHSGWPAGGSEWPRPSSSVMAYVWFASLVCKPQRTLCWLLCCLVDACMLLVIIKMLHWIWVQLSSVNAGLWVAACAWLLFHEVSMFGLDQHQHVCVGCSSWLFRACCLASWCLCASLTWRAARIQL
jgi:hypothetical protein